MPHSGETIQDKPVPSSEEIERMKQLMKDDEKYIPGIAVVLVMRVALDDEQATPEQKAAYEDINGVPHPTTLYSTREGFARYVGEGIGITAVRLAKVANEPADGWTEFDAPPLADVYEAFQRFSGQLATAKQLFDQAEVQAQSG